jgi:amino acid adenylation domain-containing protein
MAMEIRRRDTGRFDWRIERAFDQGARRWGDLAAIEVDGCAITYDELARRADRLAAQLARRGVGRGDIVGLACVDVSQFAMGALGILKAGATYLPIDLRYSLQRVPAAVFEGVAKVLIGEERLLHEVPSTLPIMGDAFVAAAMTGPENSALSGPHGTGRDPAYLCYTSGTTGVAKGALIPHAGVRGLVTHPEYEALKPGARIASCSTFAFDAITFEVWGALLNGGCVVQVPIEVVRSPSQLADFLTEGRIDGAFLTTSLFNAVAIHRPDAFGAMTTLIIGGEAVQPAYVQRVFDSGRPPRCLLNGYGPTETTTFATCHAITPADAARGLIPIGRPIEGRAAHVFRPDGKRAGPGEEGELRISGEAVALGYLNAPELTAEKFVSDAAPEASDGRMYRTGDLCKVLDNGALQYLGRIDEQVKIKGYRIEPAGVAALLRQIEGVEEAVVVPRTAALGTKQLVAFLRGDGRLSESQLHEAATRLMPDYMEPSAFEWVDRFPLTANGKLDLPVLLAGLDARRGAARESQASDELERELADIWRRNGARASFDFDTPFEETCDSLAMVGVMLDIEAAFGRQLPASALAPPRTIRSMAAAFRAPKPTSTGPVRAFYVGQPWNMRPAPEEAMGAVLGAPEGWLELRVAPAASSFSAYDSIEDLGAILEAQVVAASEGGPYTLAGHSFGGVLAFELARRLELRGERVERLVLLDSWLERRSTLLDKVWMRLRRFELYAREDWSKAWARAAPRWGRTAHGLKEHNRAELIRERCVEAMCRYAPQPTGAPAIFFRCTRYESAFDRLENDVYVLARPWKPLVGALTIAEIDCTHAEIVDSTNLFKVAEYLRGYSLLNGPKTPRPGRAHRAARVTSAHAARQSTEAV